MSKIRFNFFKNLDMYGQPIQFSYKGSSVYSSLCGIIVSIIVYIFIIVYGTLLLKELISFQDPKILIMNESGTDPALNILVPDFIQLFDMGMSPIKIPDDKLNYSNTIQVSFGIMDDQYQFTSLDPKFFFMEILQKENGIPKELFFDLCKRFEGASDEFFNYYNLNKTYCIFSPMMAEGNPFTKTEKFFQINFNFCKNHTYVYGNRNTQVEYFRLKYIFKNYISKNLSYHQILDDSLEKMVSDDIASLKKNNSISHKTKIFSNTINSTNKISQFENLIFNNSKPYIHSIADLNNSKGILYISYKNKTNNAVENKSYLDEAFYNFMDLDEVIIDSLNIIYKPIKISDFEPLICESEDAIIRKLEMIKIFTFNTNKNFNFSNIYDPVNSIVNMRAFVVSYKIKKTVYTYIQNDISSAYITVLPRFFAKEPQINYLMNFSELSDITYSDVVSSKAFINFVLAASSTVNRYYINYIDILVVMGLFGGFSRIVITIGFIFVCRVVKLKLKESLINEFYSVIDPKWDFKVNQSFDEFIKNFKNELEKQVNTDNDALEMIEKSQESKVEDGNKNDEIKIENGNLKIFSTTTKNFTIKSYIKGPLEKYFESKIEKIVALPNDSPERKKYEIIFEVFKYKIYGGFHFTTFEILSKIFCPCCMSKKLLFKDKTFLKACEQLEKDTDFVSIIKSVQEFDAIRQSFFDDGQNDLFDSIVNEEITAEIAAKSILENEESNKHNEERKKQLIKDNDYIENYHIYEDMQNLEKCLDRIIDPNRIFDKNVDLKLLLNLVENKQIIFDFTRERIKQINDDISLNIKKEVLEKQKVDDKRGNKNEFQADKQFFKKLN